MPTPPSSPISPPATPPSPISSPVLHQKNEENVTPTNEKVQEKKDSFSNMEEMIEEIPQHIICEVPKQFVDDVPSSPKHFGEIAGDFITLNSNSGVIASEEHDTNCVLVASSSDRNKLNTSTITINSDLPDPSNSLASNITQVSTFLFEHRIKIASFN